MKRKLGILLFALSLILIFIGLKGTITGGIIGSLSDVSWIFYLGLILFIISIVLLISNKKSLDYLVIPAASHKWEMERLKRAKEEERKRNIGETLIIRGKDSEEDILYLGKMLKKGDRVGFVTFPLHYLEYRELIKKAESMGRFPRGIKTENIKTRQGLKELIYGVLGYSEEVMKKRRLDYVDNRKEKYLPKIKKVIKKALGS